MVSEDVFVHTELGEIPNDWLVEPLSKFLLYISYGFTNPMPTVNSGVYMITARDINNGRIQYATARCTTQSAYDGLLTDKSRPRSGDLLLTKDGTLGRLALVTNEKICINQSVALLRPKATMAARFLKVLLEAPTYQKRMIEDAGGSTIKHIYITIVDKMPIAIPPTLAEQEAIAEALSDADAWIESLEQLIAKKRQIKQGALQELLTGKRRLPGFKGEWSYKLLGEVGIFTKGSGVSKSEANSGELPCVRYGEIYTRHCDYIRSFFSGISREVASTAAKLRSGDILFAGSGETKEDIGKCVAFIDECEAYAGGDIVILRVSEGDSLFLGYYLNTRPIAIQKASRGQGDAVVHISATALSSIRIHLPLNEEQKAIGKVLSEMDAEISEIELKLSKAYQIKQAMMQELLTGRIRLVNPTAAQSKMREAVNA